MSLAKKNKPQSCEQCPALRYKPGQNINPEDYPDDCWLKEKK